MDAEFRLRSLRGAVCEYMDEGLIDELLDDLRLIIMEEESAFMEKSLGYAKLRKVLTNVKA